MMAWRDSETIGERDDHGSGEELVYGIFGCCCCCGWGNRVEGGGGRVQIFGMKSERSVPLQWHRPRFSQRPRCWDAD